MRAQLRDGTYTFFRTTATPPLSRESVFLAYIHSDAAVPATSGTGSAAIGHPRRLLWPPSIDFCSDNIRKRPFGVLLLFLNILRVLRPASSRKRTNEIVPREEHPVF